jgi:hypothetical protein
LTAPKLEKQTPKSAAAALQSAFAKLPHSLHQKWSCPGHFDRCIISVSMSVSVCLICIYTAISMYVWSSCNPEAHGVCSSDLPAKFQAHVLFAELWYIPSSVMFLHWGYLELLELLRTLYMGEWASFFFFPPHHHLYHPVQSPAGKKILIPIFH